MSETIGKFKNGKFGLRRLNLFNGYQFWVPPKTVEVKVKPVWVEPRNEHGQHVYEFVCPSEITDKREEFIKSLVQPQVKYPKIDLGEEI